MEILNPFSKEGKDGMSFVDRVAIAVIFLLVIFLTIAVPILLIAWYRKATPKARAMFWLVFCFMYVFGAIVGFSE